MRQSVVQTNLMSRGWLGEVEPALASAIVTSGRLVTLRRRETLYQPGDDAGGMYGIIEGGLLVSTIGRDGLPVAGHIFRRGDWFGYASFFDKQSRKLIPAANEPTALLHVPLGEFERLRADFPSSGHAFGRLAMRGEGIYLAIVTDLLMANTDRRIAAVLLRVTGAARPDRPKELTVDTCADPWAGPKGVPLTQAVLAELANASPHTVARFVERAGKASWIDWRYGRVRILDFDCLAAFAAGQQEWETHRRAVPGR